MTNPLPFTVTVPTSPNGEIEIEITESATTVKYFIQVQQFNLKIRVADPVGMEAVRGENGEIFIEATHLV